MDGGIAFGNCMGQRIRVKRIRDAHVGRLSGSSATHRNGFKRDEGEKDGREIKVAITELLSDPTHHVRADLCLPRRRWLLLHPTSSWPQIE